MKGTTELENYWQDKLARWCILSLSASTKDELEIEIGKLYHRLEETLVREQSEGNSIRRVLNNPEAADQLLNELLPKLAADQANDEDKEVTATLLVTIAGVISARLDGNYEVVGQMISWCEKTLTKGYSTEDFSILKAAKYYHAFGKYRYTSTIGKSQEGSNLPSSDDLDELLKSVKQKSDGSEGYAPGPGWRSCQPGPVKQESDGSEGYAGYGNRLRLFLLDGLAQLPPYLSKEIEEYSGWLDDLKKSEGAKGHRFLFNLSRSAYAQGDLDQAISYAIEALQAAPAIDIGFISQCRQYLVTLEQEKVASETIVEKSTEKLEPKLNDLLKKQADAFKDAIHAEIKESLLRVIEILGIFLAVASVAVTAVGGISVGDSIWQSIGIFALGYLTIVSLFLFLRVMVTKPLIEIRRKQAQQTKAKTTTGP